MSPHRDSLRDFDRARRKAFIQGILSLLTRRSLDLLPYDQVREQLMEIKGIGKWTSDVYLLMAMCRADIFPLGDIALENEVAQLCRLNARPDNEWLLGRAERWRPYRAAAARMIWHSYLDRNGRHNEVQVSRIRRNRTNG